MKPEEKDYLKIVHKNNKYTPRKNHHSVEKTITSQIQFKNLNKEFKKKNTTIKNLEKKIEKLNKKLLKMLKPILNIQNKKHTNKDIFIEDMEKEEYKKNKPLINRLIRHLESERDYTKTDIKREFFIHYKKLDFCIKYLLDKGIIEYKIINGITKYHKS